MKNPLSQSDRSATQAALASITAEQRADYLWPTSELATALGIHPNKAGDWWRRTERKLMALMSAMPAETSAMLAIVMAKALADKHTTNESGKPIGLRILPGRISHRLEENGKSPSSRESVGVEVSASQSDRPADAAATARKQTLATSN